MKVFVISGIPVADGQPYGGQALARCEDCGGGVWVGQRLEETRETMARDGRAFRVLCPPCAASGDSDDD